MRQFNVNFNFVCAANFAPVFAMVCADAAFLGVALRILWETTLHCSSLVCYL
jgi:hypothetical protein